MRGQCVRALPPQGAAWPSPGPRGSLTEVELTSIEGCLEQWIGFGRIAATLMRGRSTSVAAFRPGATFAFVRWTSNDYGIVHSSIAIVTEVAADQPYAPLSFIRPGGYILLRFDEWPNVQLVLEAIDAIDTVGIDPCDAAPDHWRQVGNCIAAGLPFRPYGADRHAVWLRRRASAA